MTTLVRILAVVGLGVLAYVVFFAKPREVFVQEPAPQVEPQVSKAQQVPKPEQSAKPSPRPPKPQPIENVPFEPENTQSQTPSAIYRALQAQPQPAQARNVRKAPSVYEWEESFNSAMMEKDRSKLPERIDVAQTALNRRLEEMKLNEGDGIPEESQAIRNAQLGLNLLRAQLK